MTQIVEDYVSFEIAKLLKEKGFNEPTLAYAYGNDMVAYYSQPRVTDDFKVETGRYSLPTLQMACKWLREVHHIHIEICLYKTNEDNIEPKKSRKAPYYTFGVWDTVTGNNVDKRLTNNFIGDSYEEACKAAIEYSLENLT